MPPKKNAASVGIAHMPRFMVRLKGYPVMGFVEIVENDQGEEASRVVFPTMPVEPHFRPKDALAALDEGIPDAWYSASELLQVHGLEAAPKGWRTRKRVRMDLTPELFAGAVVEAESEAHAREVFSKTYGVRDTQHSLFSVERVDSKQAIGPAEPRKIKALVAKE